MNGKGGIEIMIDDHPIYILYYSIKRFECFIYYYVFVYYYYFLQHEYDGVELDSRSYTFIAKRCIA